MKVSRIGLFGKFRDSSVEPAMRQVRGMLESRGVHVLLGNSTATDIQGDRIDDQDGPLEQIIDIAMVVGGDGTMLHAARMLSSTGIPTVGINLGRLGFLTDISLDDLEDSVDKILSGESHTELRLLLEVKVIRQGEQVYHGIAVNDAVISKGNTGRLVEFETHINDKFVSHTRSDGLIVATPTGSTAYSLSAGGPIVFPTLQVLNIVPICPHTLSNRPIIIDGDANIRIDSLKTPETHANLSLDGSIVFQLNGDETIEMSGAADRLSMIRIDSHDHFEVLRSKLGWSG